MKTKMSLVRMFVILAMTVITFGAYAQNQDPTQSVCVGTQHYYVTANPDPNATYTWSISGGGTLASPNGSATMDVNWTDVGGPYTLSVYTTLNGCAGLPQSVAVTVYAQPVGPTLLAQSPTSPVCDGTPVSATFNAGSGGVGCIDVFEYSYDGLGVWVAYTPGTPISTTGHTLVEIRGQRSGCTTGAGCTGTPWVTLATWTITSVLTPEVVISATADPVCEGSSVTYTATVTNGGTPTYEWHVNGGIVVGTSNTYTYVPAVGDVITCIVVGNGPCVSTTPVTGTFNPIVNPKPVTSGIWHN